MHRAIPISLVMVLIALVASLHAKPASAQGSADTIDDPCPPPKLRTDIRPNAGGPPTEVSVGVRIIDLREINDVDQTLTVDIGVLRTWTDARLAHLEGCELSLEDVWYPELVALNSGRLFDRWSPEVSVGPGGQIKYVQRFYGTIASYHNLHDFPFDEQNIAISFSPLKFSQNEVVLNIDETFTGINEKLNISDWNIVSVNARIDEHYVPAFDRNHSRYDLIITAERIRAYYVWKVILPLCLIVAMSWCVFWINPAQFGPQIGLSATAMLTLIAFIFATTNMVPALGYFTLLDLFIGGSTILVFLALLESLTTSYLVSQDKAEVAQKIDRVCRIVFPLAFVALAVVLFAR